MKPGKSEWMAMAVFGKIVFTKTGSLPNLARGLEFAHPCLSYSRAPIFLAWDPKLYTVWTPAPSEALCTYPHAPTASSALVKWNFPMEPVNTMAFHNAVSSYI